jgi:hypothetical protein
MTQSLLATTGDCLMAKRNPTRPKEFRVVISTAARDPDICSTINVTGTGVPGVNVQVALYRQGQATPEQTKSVPCTGGNWTCQFVGTSETDSYLVVATQGTDETTAQVADCPTSVGMGIDPPEGPREENGEKTLTLKGSGPADKTVIVDLLELEALKGKKGGKGGKGWKVVRRHYKTPQCNGAGTGPGKGWECCVEDLAGSSEVLIKLRWANYLIWKYYQV